MSQEQFAGLGEMVQAARVVRMYYFDHRSKVEIADDLGISRFRVARLLDMARASGLVRITVTGAGTVNLDLSAALRERFRLMHAVVVNTTRRNDRETREQIGEVAADLLSEISTPTDILGIGWARVVLAMVTKLQGIKVARVVQLTGALTRPDVELSSVEVVRRVAREAGAQSSVFYAPMLVSDVETGRALYRQDQIVDAVAQFDTVTKAVVGVGGWNPPASTLHDAMTPAERGLLRQRGVHADLSGVLLNVNGEAVDTPLNGRIIAVTAEQLRRIPEVIGVAYGLEKVTAAAAALRGGYLHGLVTHTDFAEQLLKDQR